MQMAANGGLSAFVVPARKFFPPRGYHSTVNCTATQQNLEHTLNIFFGTRLMVGNSSLIATCIPAVLVHVVLTSHEPSPHVSVAKLGLELVSTRECVTTTTKLHAAAAAVSDWAWLTRTFNYFCEIL